MTINLLDINVLLALFDSSHLHHNAAHLWLHSVGNRGWSSCPLTENGFVRIISNPAYPGNRTSISDALARLRQFAQSSNHKFWPDSVSLLSDGLLQTHRLIGHRQITDAYLLALAVSQRGRLATFDTSVRPHLIAGATSSHIVQIPA